MLTVPVRNRNYTPIFQRKTKADKTVTKLAHIYTPIMVIVAEVTLFCNLSLHWTECPPKFFNLKNLISKELASLES